MRKFGLEVEYGGDNRAAAAALHAAGLSDSPVVRNYRYTSMDYWVIKTDASVHGGGEMVSPPLDFDDPDQRGQVDRAIMALRAAGCTTEQSAGIHVHIDGAGMDVTNLVALVHLYAKFEDIIWRVATSGWLSLRPGSTQYCRPLRPAQIEQMSRARDISQFARAYYDGSPPSDLYGSADRTSSHGHSGRYYGLNLHSWFFRRTVEFRFFNSSLNPERVQGYIAMCMAMMQDARVNRRRSIKNPYKLGGMHSGETNPRNAWHRFQQVLRYEAGMSLEDMKRLTMIWNDSAPQPARAGSIY